MNAAPTDIVYFAKTNFRNRERVFGIRHIDRRQHMYVMGQTGTGKSTFLKNIALQDIKSGRGVCIVDPHGEFVEEILAMIPPERANDVVYFNPADSEYPIGFNVLEVPDVNNPEYKPIAASSLMGIFTKIWANVWSARMEYILNNAILALLDNPGSTLLGVQRILVDKEYRKEILSHVKDPILLAFWTQEYEQYDPRFRNEAIAPIQNKVGQFLSSSLIRNIVGQPHSTLNLYDAMNEEKIILVNVSKGRIGEDNSQLLGAMVITKLQLAAMERVRIPEEERKDFYLYVDEFQNFATDSFASILSEARKYRLNLVMAHQYIGQLVTDTSTRVRDAVFGNIGTIVIFRIGAADAEFLENEFTPEVTIEDLVGLPNHRIFLKLMIDQVRSRPFSATTLPPLAIEVAEGSTAHVIEASRKKYTRKRLEVEEEMSRWSGFGPREPIQIRDIPEQRASGQQLHTAPKPYRKPDVPQEPPMRPVGGEPVLREGKAPVRNAPVLFKNEGIEYKTQSFRAPVEHKEFSNVRKAAPPPEVSPPPRALSLTALQLRQQNQVNSLPSGHISATLQRSSLKKTASLSELRAVLHGVLEKHGKEETKKAQSPGVHRASLQPGESVKL
ncbi:MAG: Uncharacterized protein G01um101429_933 [Parcubacteria group bacterium Gr01-1014_29]|nr:MAG: Uncharacterized protein G01um101429_933 [Parcubacteria group bacterium Gr01-1014_29]